MYLQAFQDAMAVLLTRGSNHTLSNGIVDLGGAILDLSGGDYLISAPLYIPNYYGNVHVTGGAVWHVLVGSVIGRQARSAHRAASLRAST